MAWAQILPSAIKPSERIVLYVRRSRQRHKKLWQNSPSLQGDGSHLSDSTESLTDIQESHKTATRWNPVPLQLSRQISNALRVTGESESQWLYNLSHQLEHFCEQRDHYAGTADTNWPVLGNQGKWFPSWTYWQTLFYKLCFYHLLTIVTQFWNFYLKQQLTILEGS